MKILLGSKNPAKKKAVDMALVKLGIQDYDIIPIDVPSNTSSKPIGYEIIRGAENRNLELKEYALENEIDYDYLCSIEGGYSIDENGLPFVVTYCVSEDKLGKKSTGKSLGIRLSKTMFDYIKNGNSLNKVIEYCEKPNTPKARYLYAITYAWSRVIYNERAIYYLEKYLSNELYLKYASNQNAKIQHLSEMYGYLIDCYVKDLKYDKALSTCDYYLENINISEISIYYKKADIFRRKNKLDIAINNFELAKKYTNNETDLEFIDRKIKDLKNKIEKKYVFKPKLKERKRIRIDSDDIFDLDI